MDDLKLQDFSDARKGFSVYQGANGAKVSILIDDKEYMLKFPYAGKQFSARHYSNGITSEYVGSHIFNILGIEAQKTFLGIYRKNGKDYQVVACEDFKERGRYSFYDFGALKNTIIDSSENGYGTDLDSIITALNDQSYYDSQKLEEFFWDVFVVDTLIGNFDRHNGNWGFLVDNKTNEWKLAPIFDCGSSLYPQADEETRKLIMTDKQELDKRLYYRPTTPFLQGKSKIRYIDLIRSGYSTEIDNALLRIGIRIEEKFPEILRFIEQAPITSSDKNFFSFILTKRKETLIGESMKYIKINPLQKRRKLFIDTYNHQNGSSGLI